MRYRSKLILTALTTIALLAIVVSGASARSLSVNERNFELIWNEVLGAPKTKFNFTAAGRTVSCRVTLSGSFTERTIKKETGMTQGNITHGELESCTGGTATIRTETMPWESRYRSFEGTLPRIRSINIGLIGATFKIREGGGLECEVGTEAGHPLVSIAGNTAANAETGLETTGEPENITAERNNRIPLGGGFLCSFAGEGTAEGVGLIRNLPRTAKLNVSLIVEPWRVTSAKDEDGAGHTRYMVTFTKQISPVTITSLTIVTRWTITGLTGVNECVRMFAVGASCSFTAVAEANAVTETKSLKANNVAQTGITLRP